jgi:hypothetical protein
LRTELADPQRVADLSQEVVVLSGLNQHTEDAVRHIKNLYEEAKFLKEDLEKVS